MARRIAYRSARLISRAVDKIMFLLFILVLIIGLYVVLDTGYVFYQTNPEQLALLRRVYQPEEAEIAYTLDDLSEEAIAWITIDGTTIDYPVMQAGNNTKYLNLNPLGKYSLAGSIFMDCSNKPDFSDRYTLLYGHHMSNGFMFGALDAYEDVNYMLEHQWGTLKLRSGEEYDLFVHSFAALDVSVEEVFKPGKMKDIEDFIFNNTLYNADHGDGNTIALTTCRAPGETMRTIVFCEIRDLITSTDNRTGLEIQVEN
jgi:sortase B